MSTTQRTKFEFFIYQKLDATEMLEYIADIRQAVKYAVSDMDGKELPGFSIPKKVNSKFIFLQKFHKCKKSLKIPIG